MRYNITPVAKPRMTRRDKWLDPPRPGVRKYWDFKDQIRNHNITVPESGAHIVFHMPMPKSWSKKNQREMNGKPHQVRPDIDNIIKALLDAVFDEDAHIWDLRATKLWSDRPGIVIN